MSDHVDLHEGLRIHVVGVGGAGMRAIASVLVAMGHEVSGSDVRDSFGLDRLRAEGVEVFIGHAAENIGKAQILTRSTAVPDSNAEVRAAEAQGIPIVSRASVLAAMTRSRSTISVAGTHGKTTTASMLAVILREADLDPSFIIGGEVNEIGSGAVWAETAGWFVVEADESDGTFLRLKSSRSIVTSIEPDHLTHYGGEVELVAAFDEFLEGVSGTSIVCLDDAGSARLEGREKVVTYGTNPTAHWVISDYASSRFSASFVLTDPDGVSRVIDLLTPGLHNVRNATAAIIASHDLGVTTEQAQSALAKFSGVARRFQFRGERDGVTYIDDYAHLPTEVQGAIEAALSGEWGRVICVFQPHRYSRTADLWRSFGKSFEGVDLLAVTEIYSAGESPRPGISGRLIVDAVRAENGGAFPVVFLPHRQELRTYLNSCLRPNDLCLTLGAGDLTTLPNELLPV